MAPRLRSDVQISGLRLRAEAEGLIVTVLDKGHEEGGLIFIKWVDGKRAQLFGEAAINDQRCWVRKTPEPCLEREVDERLTSERAFDPDLWVIEVMGSFSKVEPLLEPQDMGESRGRLT